MTTRLHLVVCIVSALTGLSLMVCGVFLLAGLGWALVAAAVPFLFLPAIIIRGSAHG